MTGYGFPKMESVVPPALKVIVINVLGFFEYS